MISFDDLPGNEALKAALRRSLLSRFPQTVLLTGAADSGLKTLAKVLAAALLCQSEGERPCGVCRSCRKVAGNIHPDLIIIDDGENELKVDLARRLKAENAIIPNDSERRVTIIHHAQNLNPAAQNALLKVLEEPPLYAFFVLTAEQPDALLETVRSRCTKFALEPPGQAISEAEALALLMPYLRAVAEGREDRMMLSALALEKIPRRALLSLIGVLKTALRDAVFASKALPQDKLLLEAAAETDALAQSISTARLLACHAFLDVLQQRVSRNAAAAAVTAALTSDVYRICYL